MLIDYMLCMCVGYYINGTSNGYDLMYVEYI